MSFFSHLWSTAPEPGPGLRVHCKAGSVFRGGSHSGERVCGRPASKRGALRTADGHGAALRAGPAPQLWTLWIRLHPLSAQPSHSGLSHFIITFTLLIYIYLSLAISYVMIYFLYCLNIFLLILSYTDAKKCLVSNFSCSALIINTLLIVFNYKRQRK